MSMGCGDYRCPANSNYHYGDAEELGVCYKSTTSPEQLDEYAQHCGFICVTDSWTVWKFGVPFKELTCGNCHNYAPGECTTDKDFGYLNDSRRYQGAHACKEFKKKEGENLAKKTYWTKCGIEFQKSTNADVTGYELKLLPSATDPLKVKDDIERVECRTCPFVNLVEEGYKNPVFKRFECRAGSKKPNHKTEWTGRLDDKNTININSLDHELMEEIRQYCKEQPDISASYNADHWADCRRTLSISCSSNKKGIAAKRELIEKFFPEIPTDTKKEKKEQSVCTTCGHVFDEKCDIHSTKRPNSGTYYNSIGCTFCQNTSCVTNIRCVSCEAFNFTTPANTWGRCGKGCAKGEIHKNTFICESYAPMLKVQEVEEVKEDCSTSNRACGKCNAGHWYSEENTYVSVVADDGIKTTKRPCEPHTHYCYQFTEGQKKIASDKDFNPDTAPEWCPLEKDIKYTYEADRYEDIDKPGTCLNCGANKIECEAYQFAGKADPEKYACEDWQEKLPTQNTPEKKKPRIGTESGCNEMNEDCPYFCKHNDGCGVLICHGNALKTIIKASGDVDCDVYRKVTKNVNGTPEIDTKTSEPTTFDYSTVDADTAEFLQEKASKITEIRLKSVLAIGKELKEAQDKLANNKNGTFGAWTSSIGISRQTAYNYINGYEFIVKNFDNIEAAEDLSPSLLFVAAKKDAPQELTEQVVSGDITSLKEYKAMEEKLKVAEKRVEIADNQKFIAENKAIDAAQQAKKAKKDRDDALRAYERDLDSLHQQLEQSKRNSDPKKIKELGNIISEKQQEIENLKKQLKDKPIEVPAVKEKEVIPDAVRLAIYEKVSRLYEGLCKLTETEIQIFAEDVSEDYRDDVIKGTEDAAEVLADIAHTVWKQTE